MNYPKQSYAPVPSVKYSELNLPVACNTMLKELIAVLKTHVIIGQAEHGFLGGFPNFVPAQKQRLVGLPSSL